MLSDIFGEDKREKYLIILNLIKDRDITGIIYGKKGIGKKFIITKAIRSVASDKDKVVFIESAPNWHLQLLSQLGLSAEENISKEDFLLALMEFLEGFSGRLFVVFTDAQRLSKKQLAEIVHLLGTRDKVSVVIIGDENLKETLNPFRTGKLEKALNFIFEIKPPELDEYIRYFWEKYREKVSKRAIKKLYRLTGGSIEEGEGILLGLGTFPINERDIPGTEGNEKTLFVLVAGGFAIFIFAVLTYLITFQKTMKENMNLKAVDIVLKDKKLPEEGKIIDDLPIKPVKKRALDTEKIIYYINQRLDEEMGKLEINIPQLRHYVPPEEYHIQVASFRKKENALRLKNKLSENLENVKVVEKKNGVSTVVVVVHNREKTDKIVKTLTGLGFKPLVIKVKKNE